MEQVGGPVSIYRPLQTSLEYLLLPRNRKIQAFPESISTAASNIGIVIRSSYRTRHWLSSFLFSHPLQNSNGPIRGLSR